METYYTNPETAKNLVLCYIKEFCENEPRYFGTLELLQSIVEEKGLDT